MALTPSKQTGLLIDEIMEGHFNPWDHEHVEKPERLISIRERLKELGLIDRCKQVWNIGGQQDNPLWPLGGGTVPFELKLSCLIF